MSSASPASAPAHTIFTRKKQNHARLKCCLRACKFFADLFDFRQRLAEALGRLHALLQPKIRRAVDVGSQQNVLLVFYKANGQQEGSAVEAQNEKRQCVPPVSSRCTGYRKLTTKLIPHACPLSTAASHMLPTTMRHRQREIHMQTDTHRSRNQRGLL